MTLLAFTSFPGSFSRVARSVAAASPLLLLALACGQAAAPEPNPASGGAQSSGGDVNQSGSGGAVGAGGTASGGASGGDASSGGGQAESGGAGSGGASQLDRSYAHGLVPTGIGDLELNAAWTHWKTTYVETCGDDAARVKWDEPTQTVSEGIAYGMLAAVGNADQDLFERFWKYYQNNTNENGFMHWKRAGCEGTAPDQNANNAATDADIDAAMALIQAECRFDEPGYGTAADALITSIFEHETVGSSLQGSDLLLLKPGDMFGGSSCLNPSYFAPAYYRVYAERPSQASRKDQWLKLADDSYTLLSRFAHLETGLVPNWVDEQGNTGESGPSGCTYYTDADIFGSDAVRTPWRVAVDYLWHGTPEAKTFLDKITAFVKTQGIMSVGRKYELDGTAFGALEHSILSVGAFANGAMSSDQATLDEFTAEALKLDDHRYFPDSLRVLYLLLLTGRFDACAGAHLPL